MTNSTREPACSKRVLILQGLHSFDDYDIGVSNSALEITVQSCLMIPRVTLATVSRFAIH